eukprot:606475-Prorocentrum_lima.AAC.1
MVLSRCGEEYCSSKDDCYRLLVLILPKRDCEVMHTAGGPPAVSESASSSAGTPTATKLHC